MATYLESKECSGCREEKPLSEFSSHPSGKGKARSKCKQCTAKRTALWRDKNREGLKEKARNQHMLRTYGLSLEEYNTLLKAQDHKCYICRVDAVDCFHEKLYVDHCHTTGEVRALLCHNCNAGIGHFKENKMLLQNAIFYLEEFSQ